MTEASVSDPFVRFSVLYQEMARLPLKEPAACALATASAEGVPSVRIVLIRRWDERGFCFFSHKTGPKGRDLAENPRAELCFFRDELERQVRVSGAVEPLSEAESDDYFASRDRRSRIGAWASEQSRPMSEAGDLSLRLKEAEARFEGADVPRPPFWGGWRLVPLRMEFWRAGAFRLHSREEYVREAPSAPWVHRFIYP